MSDSIGTKEFAIKFGCSQQQVAKWCREGKIPDANHDAPGSPWHIPKDAVPPEEFLKRKKRQIWLLL